MYVLFLSVGSCVSILFESKTEKKRTYIRGESASQTDGGRNNKEVLASGVPPKGLEAHAFTFGGTEGSM